jgi:mRNA interferase RelE/StbE
LRLPTLYRLIFDDRALKEYNKLGATIQNQFQKKLNERLVNPRVPADRLSGLDNCYKIKLRSSGYRMTYQVKDDIITVIVIAVGRRDSGKEDSYDDARKRLAR